MSGFVSETEAYSGPDDLASHARRHTPRSAIMYGRPGIAYVYFVYGFYHCLNVVTEPDGKAGAVLIRAIFPEQGIDAMRRHRAGATDRHLTNGPGKLCQALKISTAFNGTDLAASPDLYLEEGVGVPADQIQATPRIGVRGDAIALQREWRFVWTADSPTAAGASRSQEC
jgi:DNA-3-methyladenine glycosylase